VEGGVAIRNRLPSEATSQNNTPLGTAPTIGSEKRSGGRIGAEVAEELERLESVQ